MYTTRRILDTNRAIHIAPIEMGILMRESMLDVLLC
jgi:hypothetical protein